MNAMTEEATVMELARRVGFLEAQCQRLERELRVKDAMMRAASEINSSLSFAEVVRHILDHVHSFLDVDKVSLMLLDAGTKELRIVGARGIPADSIDRVRFKIGEGVAGWVAQRGREVVISDLSKDSRFLVLPGRQPTNGGWMICVPLTGDEGVSGVLCAEKSSPDSVPTEEAVQFIRTLSGYAYVALRNSRLHEDLASRADQLHSLHEIGGQISSALNVDRVLRSIVDHASRLLGAQICSLMLLDPQKKHLTIKIANGLSEEIVKSTVIPVGEGISGWVAKTGKPLLIQDIETHPIFSKKSDRKYTTRSLLSVPLKIEGEVIGVLNVNNKRPRGVFTEDDQNLLSLFASHAAIAIQNANLHEQVERLAITDGLTKLYVHRHFQEELEDELRRAQRYRRPVSLLMVDIDHFKKLNDTYGHQAGDAVLKKIAEILRHQAREEDLVARYGGEEFAIILRETPKQGALVAAERIKKAVAKAKFDLKGSNVRVTVSVGVSTFPDDATQREQLIGMADKALYKAKRSGRNQVCYLDSRGRPIRHLLKKKRLGVRN